MKSSIRAALAVGALALASSQASASSISVYSGMSPVAVSTSSPSNDPSYWELDVTTPTMLTRLVDTVIDLDPNPSWTVTYSIYKDGTTGSGYSYNAFTDLIDTFTFTDATFSGTSPSTWHYTSIALAGEYVLKMSTNGATASASQISAVPLPAAAWLFGSALLGFGALRRKQKAGNSEMAVA
jgi:hypothetical protein